MRVTFWGVRGSIPTPGPHAIDIGGNTSCVEVRCAGQRLVLDAGTGIRPLGRSLLPEQPLTLHLLFSHVHWDHISGFPFFAPAFASTNTLHLYGSSSVFDGIEDAMRRQMREPHFPVPLDQLGASLVFHDLEAHDRLDLEGVRITTTTGTHPGGVVLYRIDGEGRSVVYATDTEHPSQGLDDKLVRLARGADVLIYDAQYTPEEYEGDGHVSKHGWGHSTFDKGVEVARAAGAGQLVLFHHDPAQDDEAVRQKERRARELFPDTIAAYEGLSIELEASAG